MKTYLLCMNEREVHSHFKSRVFRFRVQLACFILGTCWRLFMIRMLAARKPILEEFLRFYGTGNVQVIPFNEVSNSRILELGKYYSFVGCVDFEVE